MSGAGNIFSVFDNRKMNLSLDFLRANAPKFCNLTNFKTEGLISANSGENSLDFTIDFFNPDGSYGAMCGNGGRCAARFARLNSFFSEKSEVNFKMADNIYSAIIKNDSVSLYLPKPSEIIENIKIIFDSKEILGTYVNVGSDHFVSNIENYISIDDSAFFEPDLNDISRSIRYHEQFQPRGVNVNFYKISKENSILIRTYERGVEAETGACGTGAVSTAISAALKNELNFPIILIPPSRIPLEVDVKGNFPKFIEKMILTGSAEIIAETEIDI